MIYKIDKEVADFLVNYLWKYDTNCVWNKSNDGILTIKIKDNEIKLQYENRRN